MKRKRVKDLSKRQFRHQISQDLLQYSFLHTGFTDLSDVDNSLSTDHLLNPVLIPVYESRAVNNGMDIDNESIASESVLSQGSSNVIETDIIDMDNSYTEICETEKDPQNMKSFLSSWATDYRITHSQLKPLLYELQKHNCFQETIPKDPRTLLDTPRGKTIVKTVTPGLYYHFGIKTGIEEILTKYENQQLTCVKLKIGIDGVPLTKSSTSQFWPILASVEPFPDIFLIGVYFGHEKPTYEEEFLEDFLTEIENLCNDDIDFRGNILTCEIACIICDAPAKSFLLNVKGHTGFHSCTKCIIRGKWSKNRVCFPHTGTRYKKRTDSDIRYQLHKKHQLGCCCLQRIPNLDLIKNIPLDYMHLVCLGCTKRLIYFWIVLRSKRRLQKCQISKISSRLLTVRKYTPKEFPRKPRCLKNIKFWKATEYRQFLLYTGSMVLKGILPKNLYAHFNTLHVAMRILCNETFVKQQDYLDYAEELLSYFVKCLAILYGSFIVSYNMHGLLHLVDDVRMFGSVDNFSAFKFENYMQYLKKWMRKGDKPLQQLVRRYSEFKESRAKFVKSQEKGIKINVSSEHYNGPLLDGCCSPQYQQLTIAGLKLDISRKGDSCFGLATGEIVLIFNIAHSADSNEIVIIGKIFKTISNLYTKPCQSSVVDEFMVKHLSNLQLWPLKDVQRKYMIVPSNKNEYIVSSLLHID